MKNNYLWAAFVGVATGIAIAYIRETKRLERLNRLQAEQIERLKEYIGWQKSNEVR